MSLFLLVLCLCALTARARQYSVYGCRIPCYSLFSVSTVFVGFRESAAKHAFSAFIPYTEKISSLLNSLLPGNCAIAQNSARPAFDTLARRASSSAKHNNTGEARLHLYAEFGCIAFAREGRILRVTLNRPDTLNAIDEALHHELARVFDLVNRDPDCDVVIFTGAGRAFCAGGNAAWMQTMIDDKRAFEQLAVDAKRIVFSLLELEKPIICRLNGAAAGLGATMALLCDIVVASNDASIGDPHVKMGLVAGDGGAVIWPQLIGFARAKEVLMTGEMLSAERAERIGLVNYAVPAGELDAKVDALAMALCEGATQAIRWTKTVANIPLRRLAQELMEPSLAYEMLSNATADHQEAVHAFREKRKPRFTGR